MLRVPGRIVIDVPPWAPVSIQEPVVISHWHADHWAGLRNPARARGTRLYSPTLQHAMLLMTAFSMAGVNRYSRPVKFPLRMGDVTVYYLPVVHTFEAYNYLVALHEFKTGILYTADVRAVTYDTLRLLSRYVEESGIEKLVVLADATYFSDSSVKPPSDRVVDVSWVVTRAENEPVVMPVLSTGRWASVLRLLESARYGGPVYMAGRSLHKVYALVKTFKQRRVDREYYPVRTRLPVALVRVEEAESRILSREPGVYMVAGGMVQSPAAQRLVNAALRHGYPVVVSASQLPGTPGAELLRRGLVYKLEHPVLHGHMMPHEWRQTLALISDTLDAEISVIPVHTTARGAARFTEMARDEGYYVPRYEVLDAGGIPVIHARVANATVLSGIAPEEPEEWRNGRIVMKQRMVYDPASRRLVPVSS